MATEIELKYLVLDDNVKSKIDNVLLTKQLTFTQEEFQLSNCYFDTQEQILRSYDMGLRVRSNAGKLEQTIKTAGIVVGGMHQRPEYNVDITSTFPELNLFEQKIWPADANVNDIQYNLISLFNTDFKRTIWKVQINSTVIEVAYDVGKVTSCGNEEVICELELELETGSQDDLFYLAMLFIQSLKLRPGTDSKAARGYRLWKNKKEVNVAGSGMQINHIPTSIIDSFQSGISFSLGLIQKSVARYIQSPNLFNLKEIYDGLQMAKHGFELYCEYLNDQAINIVDEIDHFLSLMSWVENAIHLQELMNKTGNYRKKIDKSEQLVEELKLEKRRLPEAEQVIDLIHSTRFNLLQLELLKVALNHITLVKHVNDVSVKIFAIKQLSNDMDCLKKTMSFSDDSNVSKYLAARDLLARCLFTGNWLGQLFESNSREEFRTPWLDISQGLSELQSLWIIKQRLEVLAEKPEKLVVWQESKVENLLIALKQSLGLALTKNGYWYE